MKNQFKVGDTVYIPSKDPFCHTVWAIERISKDKVTLWHLVKNMIEVSIDDIAESPF